MGVSPVTSAEHYYRGATLAAVEPAKAFRRDGTVFRHDDNSIYPWNMGSEFPTLRMWMDGVDLESLYADRYAVGQRGFSFFMTSEDPLHALPGPYADQQVLDALRPFVDGLQRRGFNSEACVFQAVSVTMPDWHRQMAFWDAVLQMAKSRPWMSVSLSKEWWKQRGFLDFDRLQRATGQTWDGGATADGMEFGPLRGSHFTYQASRTDDWPRKTKSGWDIIQATGQGCVTVEPMGADEIAQPGRRSNVPEDFYWSAANSRLLSMGSYFHSQAGATGQLFGPIQQQCARAHFQALSDLPLACQLGRYAKAVPGGQATQTYDELRTYGMVLSESEQWVVVTRPGPAYPRTPLGLLAPALLNGWQLDGHQRGPSGTVLRCTR
jgi:hypothetical protein